MARWKKLTTNNEPRYVNTANIAYMQRFNDYTAIFFAVGRGGGEMSFLSINVQETPDEILQMMAETEL